MLVIKNDPDFVKELFNKVLSLQKQVEHLQDENEKLRLAVWALKGKEIKDAE